MERVPIEIDKVTDLNPELLNDTFAKELVMMALISVVKDKDDYASGQDFPNIPFGD